MHRFGFHSHNIVIASCCDFRRAAHGADDATAGSPRSAVDARLITAHYGYFIKRFRNRGADANSRLGASGEKAERPARVDQSTGANRAWGDGFCRRQNNQPTTAKFNPFHTMPLRKAMR